MSATPGPTVIGLSLDAADAAALARFWAAVLGRGVSPGAGPQSAAVDAIGQAAAGPRLTFHQVPEPKTVKNRLHLDILTTRFEAETERLLGLGATRVNEVRRGDARWTTFADPEGNEFDLIAG